ncbi:hypothetical protein [Streptomyces roseifaciens]|uniref:hypothetical protein n=1 Tax=Streptomyces roseifaciens TaxID=1488406 RepID=UPI000AD7A8F2|nr:hypothetical protein [Streptomyces roseifaciens]
MWPRGCRGTRLWTSSAGRSAWTGWKIRLDRLEADSEPAGYKMVHDAVQMMPPKADHPELLLEVHARTGMLDAFERISGKVARPDDLDITPTALLVRKWR